VILRAVELFAISLVASTFGSMVGLGGGFLMVPALRVLFGLHHAIAAGTSLILIVFNSASAAVAYLRQRTVNLRVGGWLAAGALPGSIAGAFTVTQISGKVFDFSLAALILLLATDLITNFDKRFGEMRREHEGRAMPAPVALLGGLVVGFVSSLFGIGGGIVVLPMLLYLSTLTMHAISATSNFVIALSSPVGLITHVLQHDVDLAYGIPLLLGGVGGGQLGARMAKRVPAAHLGRWLAAALVVAAGGLIWKHL